MEVEGVGLGVEVGLSWAAKLLFSVNSGLLFVFLGTTPVRREFGMT